MRWRKKKDVNDHSESYHFITETIKNRPSGKKGKLLKAGGFLGAGLLFGLAAAAAFAVAAPRLMQSCGKVPEETQKVQIPSDTPQEQTQSGETQPQEKPEAASAGVQEEKNSLEEYEDAYREILAVAENPRKALVTVYGQSEDENVLNKSHLTSGQASGIIFAENSGEYYVLTEAEAVEEAETLWVTFHDGKLVKGESRKSDPRTGLAVMTVEKADIPQETKDELYVAPLGNSYSLFRGKAVIALGSPSGYPDSVSYGVITSVSNKFVSVDAQYNLLLTDILGDRQGSGVLLNNQGEIIGLILQEEDGEAYSSNMVKALAVSQLKPLLESLSNGEDIMYLGIRGEEIDESLSQSRGIPKGIYVDSVEADSPAMKAGIQSGDIICSLDEKKVSTMQEYSTYLQKCSEGEKIQVVLKRMGTENYEKMNYTIIVEGI